MICSAKIIRFFVGSAKNTAHESGTFKQLGIIKHKKIIQLIQEKLQLMGKLVGLKNR